MKTNLRAGLAEASALVGVLVLSGTTLAATDSPIANLTERWNTNAAGWTRSGSVGDGSGLWSNGVLQVSYSQRGTLDIPTPDSTYLFATNTASGGRFVGDYVQRRITGISFDIKRNAFDGTAGLYLIANQHYWQRRIPTPVGDAIWTNVVVPLTYDTNWVVACGSPQPPADLFKVDLASVTKIGVILSKNSTQGQSAILDNFKLIGPWGQIIASGPSAGLSASWLTENGLGAGANGAADDPDHDGVNNLAEFTAGTGPNDAASSFAVSIGRNAAGHTVLKWKPQAFRTYTVLQAPALAAGAGFTTKVAGLQSLGTNNEVEVDESGSGPHFYKVAVEQQVTQ